jgi:predicted deacylase
VGTVTPRVIGERHGALAGPTLIVVGGVHGNEPAGVDAARAVLEKLDAGPIALRGDLVALAGNVRALAAGTRFLDYDLNRRWEAGTREAAGSPEQSETVERRELSAVLDGVLARARGEVYFLDLHTTSAAGIPFALIGDTPRHRAFAAGFPLPVILGLEEQIDGVLTEYMTSRGCVTLVIEGGQNGTAAAAANLEAGIWVALASAGLVTNAIAPVSSAMAHLAVARGDLPQFIEVLDRHPVSAEEQFGMEPGFANIARVRKGQLLARDKSGEIRSPYDGLVLLPLYQPQGEDGFFLGREMRSWSLHLSSLGRRLHLDLLLTLLPGVRRVADGDHLALRTGAAGIYPAGLFRLFGFRRIRPNGNAVHFARRVSPSRLP